MKITDIKKSDLPLRVKLTEGFNLEESFDHGMIVQINNYKIDWESDEGAVYEVDVTALTNDFEHNNKVAKKDWYDIHGNPSLNIFEALQENPGTKDFITSIYVMEKDDFCELVSKEKGYILEVTNAKTESGNICSLMVNISEETKNLLSQLSSLEIDGGGVGRYTIENLKFLIHEEGI